MIKKFFFLIIFGIFFCGNFSLGSYAKDYSTSTFNLQVLNQHLTQTTADAFGTQVFQPTQKRGSLFKSLLPFMQIFIFIAIVFMMIWLVRYMFQNRWNQRSKTSCISILETYPLSKDQALYLVDIAGKFLVLGASRQAVSFITEITDSETKKNIMQNVSQQKSFQHYLSFFSKKL